MKDVWILVLRFFVFFFICVPRFSLVLEHRGIVEGLVGKAGNAVRNLKTVYWVNVYESSGTGLCGLFWTKGH